MTCFAMICSTNTISSKFRGIRGINHLRSNRGRAKVPVLHIGAGHTNNCQVILKLFGYEIFCNNLQHENNFKQIWRCQSY